MQKLTTKHKIEKGDIITTTGVSGLYPKGLVIGEVTEICYDNYNTSYYAVVKPYDNIKTIRQLAVITDYEGQGEVLLSDSIDEETEK